ncbi:hypothetical protein [Paenibacillus pedocola]|uniref:hypothetical protein n=1 Tax=Paenibacillus pedocola TaxID=3242193 RepID=UPI0028780157|nr:hypothetical protein [Paenibacillus typhae]
MKQKFEKMIPFIIKTDIFLGILILVLTFMGKSEILNPQWFAVNFFIFIGGLYIYSKTKNKIFYCVFIYALIFSLMILIDMMLPGGIISENNTAGDHAISGGLIVLGIGGFFATYYYLNKKK